MTGLTRKDKANTKLGRELLRQARLSQQSQQKVHDLQRMLDRVRQEIVDRENDLQIYLDDEQKLLVDIYLERGRADAHNETCERLAQEINLIPAPVISIEGVAKHVR